MKQPGLEALGGLDYASGKVSSASVLAARLASEAHAISKTETNARNVTGWDAVWFVNMPNAPDFGRREIAGFIKSRVFQKFDFLNHASTGGSGGSGSTPASGSSLPEFPQIVATDLRTRRTKQTKSSSNNRDHVAYFMGRYLTVAEVRSLVTGREGWVVPLTIKVRQTASGSNLDVEQLASTMTSATVEEGGPALPQPPLNAFEMLENSEPVIVERPFDATEVPSSEDVGTSKKSKKKKKPRAEDAVAAVVEKAVEKIENPQVQVKAANLCAHSGCKEKLGVMGQHCQFCDRKYCLAHRFPEVHSEICGTKKKNQSQTSFKNDARLGIAIGKKETQGGKSGSLAKEREDAKKRLAERIKNARK
ncbi:DNA-binding protein SMUBP-2 [Chytriomyces hyalinus]|nr:DNA-binding protein SMUBP-2 [Chytriomyces hyalinus]